MTEVAFHLNVQDVGAYACRLLRKAYLKGARVRVLADEALSREVDRRLWLMAQGEFIPHASEASPERVRARSPIVFGAKPVEGAPVLVLVNLSMTAPEMLQQVERVIEVVGPSESDREGARHRWKAYRNAGMNPVAIDMATRAET